MIGEWCDSMHARGLSEATIRRGRLTLTRFAQYMGTRGVLAATPAEVDSWLDSLGVCPSSRKNYAGDLKSFYRWAIRRELTDRNPLDGREPEKLPRRLPRPIRTPDLTTALEQANPRTRQMLVLAAFAGLRAHEIAGLDAADIDRDRGVLTIRGKGGKEREVPLHPLVAEVTANVRRGPVITNMRRPGNLSSRAVQRAVAAHLRANGVDKTCHPLRHWFATETYRATKDLRAVQELLGHASPTTTAVYTLVEDDAKTKAVSALALLAS